MAESPVWHLFAYMNADEDGRSDEHRHVPDWRLEDVLRWATTRGYDNILLTRVGVTEFRKARPAPVEHSFA